MNESNGSGDASLLKDKVDVCAAKDSFPMCIVWCPIPVLSWFLPIVGHVGIVTTEGIIHDFAGPYFIHKSPSTLGFGSVTKYLPVLPRELSIPPARSEEGASGGIFETWNSAVEDASAQFEHTAHNLITNNCHAHVAHVLNQLEYRGHRGWNTVTVMMVICFKSSYVSFGRFLITWLPFIILFALVLLSYFVLLSPS